MGRLYPDSLPRIDDGQNPSAPYQAPRHQGRNGSPHHDKLGENKMTVFRTRSVLRGAHYHVTVFVAPHIDQTFSNTGTLVMGEDEYKEFQRRLKPEQVGNETHGRNTQS